MKRTNGFEVVPQSDEDEELLRQLLDASVRSRSTRCTEDGRDGATTRWTRLYAT
ncbi:hypothetical protein MBEHAL_2580 [Halarchaeum acidiphilum MH1-52-1]|uniref:Uncharacterized protein n=1 Tax=Halarchaeum acidiphilum MH1-52-1 TaxID=1261545 RepID=U2YXQ4_9EURY|nr:hypothetical protein MBEHAL_2580 [Halarchaeum acidiphilum MH1-52-1]